MGLGDSKEKHVIHRVKHSVISKTELRVPSGTGTTATTDLGLITMCDKHFFLNERDYSTGLIWLHGRCLEDSMGKIDRFGCFPTPLPGNGHDD